MEELLRKHQGREIGINWQKPGKADAATLIAVHEDWFTVRVDSHSNLTIHFNTKMLISATEGQFTATHGGAAGKSKVNLLVQMHSLVIPGNEIWIGVGF